MYLPECWFQRVGTKKDYRKSNDHYNYIWDYGKMISLLMSRC